MENLKAKKCVPCEEYTDPLKQDRIDYLKSALSRSWQVIESHHLELDLVLKNFLEVIDVVNKIAKLAEEEGHHPNLFITDYKKLKIQLFTHNINGLSDNDFILAAKIESILPN